MNLPRQYSYNPRWWIVALNAGAGFTWLTLQGLFCGCRPHGLGLWFGVLPIMLGLLVTVRRLVFDTYLVLDKDAVILPTGFGRVRTKRFLYAGIERVWETRLPYTVVLSVATKEGKFEVVSSMLPDANSYLEVGKFLYAQLDRPNG